MCARYTLTSPEEALRRLFGYAGAPLNLAPRYNIAPTQTVPVVRRGADGGRGLAQLRWGLIPSWAKAASIGARMINARSETVAEKPAFRAAFRARRCLVPADGFYEWQGEAAPRRPHRIAFADVRPFAFAGIWESWRDPAAPADARPVETFAILTTAAAPSIAAIHDRMPVILPPDAFAAWLDPAALGPALQALLVPWAGEALTATALTTRVNSVKNDDPAVLAPA